MYLRLCYRKQNGQLLDLHTIVPLFTHNHGVPAKCVIRSLQTTNNPVPYPLRSSPENYVRSIHGFRIRLRRNDRRPIPSPRGHQWNSPALQLQLHHDHGDPAEQRNHLGRQLLRQLHHRHLDDNLRFRAADRKELRLADRIRGAAEHVGHVRVVQEQLRRCRWRYQVPGHHPVSNHLRQKGFSLLGRTLL